MTREANMAFKLYMDDEEEGERRKERKNEEDEGSH